MLSVEVLRKSYSPDTEILKGISFHITKGSITSLLGPNGAGKTTTLDIITGVKKKDYGKIIIDREEVTNNFNFKEKIGVMLQDTKIYKKIRVKEALELFASFYKNSVNIIDLMESIGLKGFERRFFSTLSGGEKQKLFLGIALVNDPTFLILDEPTSALDPISKREFWNLLNKLKKEGKTILLSTHNLEEAEFLSDKIMIIKKGTIIASGTIDDVRKKLKWGKTILLTVNPKHIDNIYINLLSLDNIEIKIVNNTIEIKCDKASEIIQSLTKKYENWDDYFINIEIKSVPLEKVFMEIVN